MLLPKPPADRSSQSGLLTIINCQMIFVKQRIFDSNQVGLNGSVPSEGQEGLRDVHHVGDSSKIDDNDDNASKFSKELSDDSPTFDRFIEKNLC